MPKFEYCTRYLSGLELKEYQLAKFLNEMGGDGWELVQVIERHMINDPLIVANRTFIFKRQLQG